jgi:hypothetical protein
LIAAFGNGFSASYGEFRYIAAQAVSHYGVTASGERRESGPEKRIAPHTGTQEIVAFCRLYLLGRTGKTRRIEREYFCQY